MKKAARKPLGKFDLVAYIAAMIERISMIAVTAAGFGLLAYLKATGMTGQLGDWILSLF